MRNNFFEVTWSKYIFWHMYLVWPTEHSEEKYLKISVGFWKFFASIGLWPTKGVGDFSNFDGPKYGFMYSDGTFFIYRGLDKVLYIDMPWKWQIVRHDLLLPDGSVYESNRWTFDGKSIDKHYHWYEVLNGWHDKKIQKSLLEKYTRTVELDHYTKDGRRQQAVITLTGEEREWRWKWFTWLPLFLKVERVVSCDSNVELGKKAGSWKGGLMGWSCEWDLNESMEMAFRRWYDKWDGN
jgi:hypothetical protein